MIYWKKLIIKKILTDGVEVVPGGAGHYDPNKKGI